MYYLTIGIASSTPALSLLTLEGFLFLGDFLGYFFGFFPFFFALSFPFDLLLDAVGLNSSLSLSL